MKAAKKEGHVNVITIPLSGWANYGAIMKDFTKKYGIKINDQNPNGSSAQEITAIQTQKGRADAPDVVDVGTNYATGNEDLWAPYKVATWANIPSSAKDASGRWYDDYGGYVAIGCDTKIVTTCPTSFAQLSNPMYKNEVAINNDPTSASAAFYAVWAAAIANGGSFSNIQPGITFFANLNKDRQLRPGGTAATAASRERRQSSSGGTTCKRCRGERPGLEVSDPDRRHDRGVLHPGDHQRRSGPGGRSPLGGVLVLVRLGQNLFLQGLRPSH
jgi:putative spermidine/putrescine transport system substrate-binding protein